jgi:pilus assembly protein Flp/PilA
MGAFQGDVQGMNSTCYNTQFEVSTVSTGQAPLPGFAHHRLSRLRRKAEQGATAVEYALMVGLIAVGIITAVAALRNKTSSTFNTVNSAMGSSASASLYTSISQPAYYYVASSKVIRWWPGPQTLPAGASTAATPAALKAIFDAAGWLYVYNPGYAGCGPTYSNQTCFEMDL